MMEISEEFSVVAFYGVDMTTQTVSWFYDTIVRWFNEMDRPPDKAAIRGQGHSGKLVSFDRARRIIEKTGITNVADFELYASTDDRNAWSDYLLETMCSKHLSFIYVAGRASIAPLLRSDTLMLAKRIAERVGPEYGIGYTRERHLGPSLYVAGISQGLGIAATGTPEREQALRISFWGRAMVDRLWKQGVLRDVYPVNFLNTIQLDRCVGKLSLKQWIQMDPCRGQLEAVTDELSLWEVANGNLMKVREDLRTEDIIFDWRKYYGQGHPER